MTENRSLSQSRIATYLQCPSLYRFRYDWDITVPNETERFYDRGQTLHETIEDVCESVRNSPNMTDAEIRTLASERFPVHWRAETNRSEYVTDVQYEEDRLVAAAAISTFFGGDGSGAGPPGEDNSDPDPDAPGLQHARQSVATELRIECEIGGHEFTGRIDNVLETETGYHLIDYKTSDMGVVFPSGDSYLERHYDSGTDDWYPRRAKAALQAAIYLRGFRETDLHTKGDPLEFTYSILLYDTSIRRRPGAPEISVRNRNRSVAEGCAEHAEYIESVIRSLADGIHEEAYEPAEEHWPQIHEEECGECPYRSTCSFYLNEVMGGQ